MTKMIDEAQVEESLTAQLRVVRRLLHLLEQPRRLTYLRLLDRRQAIVVVIAELHHGLISRVTMIQRHLEIVEGDVVVEVELG